MSLHDRMVSDGHLMFSWRSYLPLLLLGPFIIAAHESAVINGFMGEEFQHFWVFTCFFISLSGFLIRCVTVGFVPGGTSGRNTKGQRADYLNRTGMYSIVRNPLYLGNFIIILGVLLSIKVWWLVIIGSLGFFIYMESIILSEEKYLREKFGDTYVDWCKSTPAIVPNFKNWVAPELPFSFRTVLKREYPGLLGIATAFFVTEIITDLVFEKENITSWMQEDILWIVMFASIATMSLILRLIKKKTTLLKVKGR